MGAPKDSEVSIDSIGLQYRSGNTHNEDNEQQEVDTNTSTDDTTISNKFPPRPDIKIIKIRRY